MSESSSHSNTFIITYFRLIIEVGSTPTQDFLITAHATRRAAPWDLQDSSWCLGRCDLVSLLSAQVGRSTDKQLPARTGSRSMAFFCLLWLCFVIEGVSQFHRVGLLAE